MVTVEFPESKILVASHVEKDVITLADWLQSFGYDHVRFAADGTKAVEMAREWKPDLLLLRIDLPQLSGLEICQQLKAGDSTAGMLILMITPLKEAGDIAQAVESGCDDFLPIPVDREELQIRIRSHLKVQHLLREREERSE